MHKLASRIEPSKGPPPHPAKDLRRKATAMLGRLAPVPTERLGSEASERLLHELRMHQLELELQNLELRQAQEALESSRKRYVDLYDHAPVGYLTLNKAGLILEANLTAATLLGLSRQELHRQPITRFILPEDQDVYYLHRIRQMQNGPLRSGGCELRLARKDASPFWARLEGVPAGDSESGVGGCRVAISDITAWKDLGPVQVE